MTPATPPFDPQQYKQTTKQQWQTAADAWDRWGPVLSAWLGPATERMLDLTGVGPGSRVLDVAAGAGEQTVTTARRVGPTGMVLATDISDRILEFAAEAARRAKLTNVQTRVLDGENLDDLAAGSFDAVISRVGLIYFPDQQKALRGMLQVLRPGGKIGAMVYSTAESNKFFSMPVSIIRRRAKLPPPATGQPGPFSLGSPGVLEAAFQQAGFRNIRTERVLAPLCLPSASECVRFERESFGALHQMLSGLTAPERDAAWQEIEQALQQFERSGTFEGPCEVIIAAGER